MTDSVLSHRGELWRRSLVSSLVMLGALATLTLVPLAALRRVDSVYSARRGIDSSVGVTSALQGSVAEQRRLLLAYRDSRSATSLDQLDLAGRTTLFSVGQIAVDDNVAKATEAAAHLRSVLKVYQSAVDETRPSAVTGGQVGDINGAFDRADGLLDQMNRATVVLRTSIGEKARAVDDELGQVLGRAHTAMLVSSLVTFVITAAAGLVNVRTAVTRSEDRFRSLVQNTHDMLMTIDWTGRITYASPAVSDTIGYPLSWLIGRPLTELVHPEDHRLLERTVTPRSNDPRPAVQASNMRLRCADGSWRDGEALVSRLDDTAGTDDSLVLTIRDVTERLELASELRRRSTQDPGTGLSNRAALKDSLAEALAKARREGSSLSLIAIQLSGLREVRDLRGSVHSDAVISIIASRIRAAIEDFESIARLSDDELAVVTTSSLNRLVLSPVVGDLARPVVFDGVPTSLTAFAGLAGSAGDLTPDELMRNAGLALQSAQLTAARQPVAFDSSLHRAAVEQAQLITDLHAAIADHRLVLHYQPIILLATGQIVGAEALARWSHPVHGSVPPNKFIPLAESSGDINSLGRWALDEGCRQLAAWSAERPDVRVTINASTAQLLDPAFVGDVAAAISRGKFDPRCLVLEITESGFASDAVLASAQRLRQLGIGVAIDDFGTGYSTLSYLGRMPVTTLKIDKSFVDRLESDARSQELVGTIIDLAHSFDLNTVAEGIETEQQAKILTALGCVYGQGYFYSRAVPADKMTSLLSQSPSTSIFEARRI